MRQLKLNGALPRGTYKTKDGHLRYYCKELKGEYVHRHVIKEALNDTPYSIKLLLPWPYEVHHIDFNKENNERCNLLMCSEAFHSAMTSRGPHGFGSKFHPKFKPPPEWVLFDYSNSKSENCKNDEDSEVPF